METARRRRSPYRVVPDIETGEGIGVEISVADGGASATWGSDMIFRPDAYIADLDGDGATEVLVSGDWASADFVTWGLRWDGHAFQRLSFASDSRSGAGAGYTDEGYGHVFAIGDGRVTLIGAYDALGTYSATRVYALRDGVFEFADDGLWHVQVAGYAWDIPLVTTREVSATFVEDGAEVEGTLPVGARLIITASDGTSVAWFETEDGCEGYLSIAPDAQRGWGSTVDGVPEDDRVQNGAVCGVRKGKTRLERRHSARFVNIPSREWPLPPARACGNFFPRAAVSTER